MTAIRRRTVSEDEYQAGKAYGYCLRQLPPETQKTFVDMFRGAVALKETLKLDRILFQTDMDKENPAS